MRDVFQEPNPIIQFGTLRKTWVFPALFLRVVSKHLHPILRVRVPLHPIAWGATRNTKFPRGITNSSAGLPCANSTQTNIVREKTDTMPEVWHLLAQTRDFEPVRPTQNPPHHKPANFQVGQRTWGPDRSFSPTADPEPRQPINQATTKRKESL